MQRSSPLAAMQPAGLPYGAWGCRPEAHSAYMNLGGQFGGRLDYGPTSFNFKDLSMDKVPVDYFNLNPMRGSSPTASLAADLSTNFHIDRSPQLPTPRRSLFSANLFGSLNGRASMKTPPPPSSSPGPGFESMEISPLPHKPSFVVETQEEPIPRQTPDGNITLGPDAMLDSPSELQQHAVHPERRRPSLLRPSLSRAKGFTTSAVTFKSARVECPPFKFGNGLPMKSTSLMSPEDCFTASPQRDRRPQTADSPSAQPMGPPPKYRQSSSTLRANPPIVGHVRKPSNPMQRPRKHFRRSLSMFEHPADVMKQEEAEFSSTKLDPVMDIDDPPRLQLPHFHAEDESLPRITKEIMVDVLNGKFVDQFSQSLIVDCRFEYEYEGGHIDGAVNYNDKEKFSDRLFDAAPLGKTLLIFHCEYSACRAPLMAKHIRGRDRDCNAHRYPNLTYPEIYILDGGYSAFFAGYKLRCSPQNYVEMGDKKHENACERGMGRVKQQRGKLSRAQTFAFGQHSQSMDDSPTASGRQGSRLLNGMEIVVDSPIDTGRSLSGRMVSF